MGEYCRPSVLIEFQLDVTNGDRERLISLHIVMLEKNLFFVAEKVVVMALKNLHFCIDKRRVNVVRGQSQIVEAAAQHRAERSADSERQREFFPVDVALCDFAHVVAKLS
jgi:hypothetical protein